MNDENNFFKNDWVGCVVLALAIFVIGLAVVQAVLVQWTK